MNADARPVVGITARQGVIPALDAETVDENRRVVEATTDVDGIVAYKMGLSMVLDRGLAGAVDALRQVTDLPLIYDHQKAGCDIPDMGPKFAALCKKAGVDGLILFPVAGPLAVDGFVGGSLQNGLMPIVGGDLPFPTYNASGGGYVVDDSLSMIFERSVRVGCDHFVIPGNDGKKIAEHAARLVEAVDEPWLFIPGIGALGGSIAEAFKPAEGCRRFAIIGRGIYGAADPTEAAKTFASEALEFA